MTAISETIPLERSLAESNRISELRALWAIVWREWIIFLRYPSWIISLFLWPILFPLTFILTGRALSGPDGSGLQAFFTATGSHDFIGFIAIGTTIWMWQNTVLWNVGYAIRSEQWRGTLESNWLSPTWRFSFLLGTGIPQFWSMGIFILVSVIEFTLFFGVRLSGNPLLMLLMLLVSIPSIYGWGFTFASLVISVKEANTFVFLVRGLVMIFCGITYPLTLLPNWMQGVAKWLPQSYMIHGIRLAALNNADLAALLPDIQALLLFGVLWLVIGYLLFTNLERRARKTGALSQY
jgi:ABC-2 type transport system permease protein